MMILTSFIQNNKKYVYLLEQGKIKYGYQEKGKIKHDLTEKEIDFMNFKVSMLKYDLKIELSKGFNYLFLLFILGTTLRNHFPYSEQLITYAIEKNEDLTEQEKNYLLSKLYILDENKEYINTLEVYDNLTHLDVEYAITPNSDSIENNFLDYNNPIYHPMMNDADSFEATILLHETVHCFSNCKYQSGLNEAVIEVMANEYVGELNLKNCNYQDEVICFYTLKEVIGIEPFKMLTLRGTNYYIINELMNIIPNRNLANQLIENIDNLANLRLQNNEEEYEQTKRKIYEIIGEYFERKYGYQMNQDEIMMLYFSYGQFISKDMEGYQYVDNIHPSGSFSENYILENPDIIYVTHNLEQFMIKCEEREKQKILKLF